MKSKIYMISMLTLSIMILCASIAAAHKPVMVGKVKNGTATEIEDPLTSHAYYGELTGKEHFYYFTMQKPFNLYANILVPWTMDADRNMSILIVRQHGQSHKLLGTDHNWTIYHEKYGDDMYLKGPEFRKEMPPGTYIIAVGSADNIGKYTLAIGEEESFSVFDYITMYPKAWYLDWWFFN